MATETLRPNGAGSETSIGYQKPDSDEHWDKVDEAAADDDTTYVYSYGNTYERDLYNIADHSASGTINSITVYARCKANATVMQANLKICIKSNSTVTEDTAQETTASWDNYSKQWTTNPADSEAWEWDDIDSLQIGVALRRQQPVGGKFSACTQVYVEVDYTAVTPKTSSDAGSGVDTVDSLEKGEVKTSSDAGSGVEGTPMQSAILVGSETGFSIEALITRLLTGDETGTGIEVGGLLKDLFVSELGQGSDSFTAKIEAPTKGGGMKLWI